MSNGEITIETIAAAEKLMGDSYTLAERRRRNRCLHRAQKVPTFALGVRARVWRGGRGLRRPSLRDRYCGDRTTAPPLRVRELPTTVRGWRTHRRRRRS